MVTRICRGAPNHCSPLPPATKFIGAGNCKYATPYRIRCVDGIWMVTGPSGELAVFRDQVPAYEHAVERYRQTVLPQLLARPSTLTPLRGAEQLACGCPEGLPCHGDVLIELLAADIPAPRPSPPLARDRRGFGHGAAAAARPEGALSR